MADGTLAITAGTGTSLKTSLTDSGANHVQYIRELAADTASAPGSWTLSTTASTPLFAANADRMVVLLVHNGTSRVYFRFDTTAPTAASNHWWLDPGERWEVPELVCRMAMSAVAAAGGSGTINWILGTKA